MSVDRLESQKLAIATLLQAPELHPEFEALKDEYFTDKPGPPLRTIWIALKDLIGDLKAPTAEALVVKTGLPLEYIYKFYKLEPDIKNSEVYVSEILEGQRQQILQAIRRTTSTVEIRRLLDQLDQIGEDQKNRAHVGSVIDRHLAYTQRLAELSPEDRFVSTPFSDFDRLYGGLLRGRLMILAARPAMGKTAMMLNIIMHALKQGKVVHTYALDEQPEALIERLSAQAVGASLVDVIKQTLPPEKEAERVAFLNTLRELPWHIYGISDGVGHIEEFRRSVYTAKELPDLITIDYLQLFHYPDMRGSRVQEVSYIARKLAEVCHDLFIPLLVLAQLNRDVEARQDKRPQLSDLRDSGEIEQAADVVGFLYRDEYYYPDDTDRPGIAELDIAKCRLARTGVIDLFWDGPKQSFRNLQRQGIF